MKVAYVDTSCLVAVVFQEARGKSMARHLGEVDHIVASNLLEAELRSAFARESVDFPPALLNAVSWIIPDRPLHQEIQRVLAAGYVRGADCWHLATALYLSPEPGEMIFLTLDERQRGVARALGFST